MRIADRLNVYLVAIAVAAVANAGGVVALDQCAANDVSIRIGDSCGGTNVGCCQPASAPRSRKLFQTAEGDGDDPQFTACSNPDVSKQPGYCSQTSLVPWDCGRLSCERGAVCLCASDNCTCTAQGQVENLNEENKFNYNSDYCNNTTFAAGDTSKIACQGPPVDDESLPDPKGSEQGQLNPGPPPSLCATDNVTIPLGQRCGGDRDGCCQPTNIGSAQNQYPACNNPSPSRKPAYCKNISLNPWDCDKFQCTAGSICACAGGDCTCTANSDYSNIINNGKGYDPSFCTPTSFAGGNKTKYSCRGPEGCPSPTSGSGQYVAVAPGKQLCCDTRGVASTGQALFSSYPAQFNISATPGAKLVSMTFDFYGSCSRTPLQLYLNDRSIGPSTVVDSNCGDMCQRFATKIVSATDGLPSLKDPAVDSTVITLRASSSTVKYNHVKLTMQYDTVSQPSDTGVHSGCQKGGKAIAGDASRCNGGGVQLPGKQQRDEEQKQQQQSYLDTYYPQGVNVCANASVVIPVGQRCGGDRNGCCQSTNIGSKQNQYPACNNPDPSRKPAYCSTGNFSPWDCDQFSCADNSICACTTGDCTCTSRSNFNNIKNNLPYKYDFSHCNYTSFNKGDQSSFACQGVGSYYCFPAASSVLVQDSRSGAVSPRSMSQLSPGDIVQVVNELGELSFSPIFLIPHRVQGGSYQFVQLSTASSAQIRMTPDHYAYVASSPSAAFKDRTAVAAGDVRPGDWVWHSGSRKDGIVVPDRVVDVKLVDDVGIVTPLTLQGTIVVEGIAASVYGNVLGSENASKALAGVGRAIWRLSPALVKMLHRTKLAEPISLATTYTVQKNADQKKASNRFFHWAALQLTGHHALPTSIV